MSRLTPVHGWSGLLLALPEFDLTDAQVSDRDEIVADVELPRDVEACPDCGVFETHPLHD